MDTISSENTSSHQKHHLALRVALDTMKDRCILQQKRLSEIEEENQQLRERLTQNSKPNSSTSYNAGGVAENFQLRLQVSELQRQNVQLNAHVNMVSAENRKLWQRLSQIAKEQSRPVRDKDTTLTNVTAGGEEIASPRSATGSGGSANINLIRSKTFTQHSPNPNLRHKLLLSENGGSNEILDASLETDVALEVFDDDNGKEEFGVENDSTVSQITMGFGYLNVDDSSSSASSQEQDFNTEVRKCMEGLQEMRLEAMKQQQELSSVFALLESRIALQPCPECVKKSHKPEMADKSLETDESLNDATKYNNFTTNNVPITYTETSAKVLPTVQNNHLNIIQEKILADEANNMCPMCGKIYGSQVTFESFCEHVEEHFRDEGLHDIDHSIEHNFELISHSVGDF